MTIFCDSKFMLNGVVSHYCLKVVGNKTVAALARIKKRSTSKREAPPVCRNGFATAGLPFAKGHVIALELSGSDEAHNVVPQFEDWQGKQNGAWRQMEVDLLNEAGKLM